MSNFETYSLDALARGEMVNIHFEERLFGLIGMVHQITDTLKSAAVPYEVVGGLAVVIYVEEVSPELTVLTKHVDLMIHRSDLERIKDAGARDGFRFEQGAKGDRLIHESDEKAKYAVRLVFSGEIVSPTQRTPNPAIEPVIKVVHKKEILVISIADLIRMKLNSYRLVDMVHIQTMLAAGLVTIDIENTLTPKLAARLKHIRESD